MSVSVSDRVPLQPVTFDSHGGEQGRPRAVVVVDGIRYIPEVYNCTSGAHGAGDVAHITLPIANNPDFSVQIDKNPPGGPPLDLSPKNPPSLASIQAFNSSVDASPVYAEIYAGFPQNPQAGSTDISQLSRRFLGVVDMDTVRFGAGRITFACRSLAAPLLRNTITTYTQNQTTQAFITAQAEAIGLRTSFKLANPARTLQEVLAYDQVGGSRLNGTIFRMKVWDLMLRCAQVDDVDLWVDAFGVLHYEAPWLIARNRVALVWGRDIEKDGLEATHSPQFSNKIRVDGYSSTKSGRTYVAMRRQVNDDGSVDETTSSGTVTTYNVPGTNQSVTTNTRPDGSSTQRVTTYQGGGATSGSSAAFPAKDSGVEHYVVFLKNASAAYLQQYIRAVQRQISMFEWQITAHVPVTAARLAELGITSLIDLSGTPYEKVNSQYWPREIAESFDPKSGGWTLDIHAVNHTPPMGGV